MITIRESRNVWMDLTDRIQEFPIRTDRRLKWVLGILFTRFVRKLISLQDSEVISLRLLSRVSYMQLSMCSYTCR